MPISRDLGGRHIRRFGAVHLIIGLIGVMGIGSLMAIDFVRHRHANVDVAKRWDIKGPPCPTLTAAQWAAQHQRAEKSFDYDGQTIARHAGHASCQDVQEGGGTGLTHDQMCQFTSPSVLAVTTPKGTFYFNPGVGQPASLIIEHDQPRCILASRFTLTGGDRT